MKKLKKILFCIICNAILSATLVQNVVYADLITTRPRNIYLPLYYVSVIVAIIIVVIISICVLRKIYKENQAEKNETRVNKGGMENEPKL